MNTKFVPRLSRPCSEDWRAMSGDEKRRFCERCQLHVHNLSAMSSAEQEALLFQRGGRTCIAYSAANDSIRVRTGTWLLLQRLLRFWRAGVAFLTILLPAGFSGCSTSDAQPAQQAQNTKASDPTPTPTPAAGQQNPPRRMLLGVVCPPRPLWHRIIFFWK